jgi:hypothetical protein
MKMLINCRACAREISPNAASCPHCGEPRPETQPKPKQSATGVLAAIIIGLIIGVPLYFMVLDPAEQAKKYAADNLKAAQDLNRDAQKWSDMARRARH